MKLIIVPPKSVSLADKQVARKAGFVIIEMKNPKQAVIMDEGMVISGSEVLNASISSLAKCDNMTGNSHFIKKLNDILNPPPTL